MLNNGKMDECKKQIDEYSESKMKDASIEMFSALFVAKASAFLDGLNVAYDLEPKDYKELLDYANNTLRKIRGDLE